MTDEKDFSAAEKEVTVNDNGGMIIQYNEDPQEVKQGGDVVGETPTITRWSIPPNQVAQHLPMFENKLSKGDVSAMKDSARDYQREQKKLGR